jgi:DMSO/TMAO reductase YedYZ molybdopterin-dependent catalytic subunit
VLTSPPEIDSAGEVPATTVISRPRAATAGAVAALVALAIGELTAALLGSGVTLVTAVGSVFIDRFAASLKDLAVALFGTNDKVALVIGIVVVSATVAGALGVVSRRWLPAAPLGIAVAGLGGAYALATDPLGSTAVALAAGTASIAAGLAAFAVLWAAGSPPDPPPATAEEPADARLSPATGDRRRFLVSAFALIAGSGIAALLGRRVRAGDSVEAERSGIVLPRPEQSTPIPAGTTVEVDGVTPYVTANSDFYRIDTALVTPQVDAESWTLELVGLVDRPFQLTYDELLRMDSVETPVTLQCVSNEVGGDLIGNAVWQGVPLADLLDRAGVSVGASQVVGRSVDGFTAGFPLADALDGRTALVAYAMNGEPLPAAHGYPARLVVAGLYGYVSATKWLRQIELTTWDAFDGYWVPRGWSKTGPVKTQSRIDVPSGDVSAGRVMVAGVAWATGRGIERVEVQIDDEPWQPADLGAVANDETWRTWRLQWQATPGRHRLRVRATDGDGETQTAEERPPAPDGATGWHTRTVTVT